MMWRIMQISEDVINFGRGECPGVDDILLDLQNSSHHTEQPHSIIANS